MKWRNVILVAILSMPLLVVLALGFGSNPRATPSVLEGDPAPNFDLQTLDGGSLTLSELEGQPVVLNFWATWCEPCKVEHRHLQTAHRRFGDAVQFVGIVYQDTPAAARKYLDKRRDLFPQVHDAGGRVGVDYGVTGVPETFFINADGRIVKKHTGALTPAALLENLARVGVSTGKRQGDAG